MIRNMLYAALFATYAIGAAAEPQWEPDSGVPGGIPLTIIKHNQDIYAGELNNHLLRTQDLSKGWTPITNTQFDSTCSLAFDGDIVYTSGLDGFVQKTTTEFKTATQLPIKNSAPIDYCSYVLVQNHTLLVAAGGHIYFSDNEGASFQEASYQFDTTGMDMTDLYQNTDGILIATTDRDHYKGIKGKGIIYSKDGGHTWMQSDALKERAYKSGSATSVGSTFYVVSHDGILLTSNDGETWKKVGDKLPAPADLVNYTIAADTQGHIYVFTGKGVMMNQGETWKLIKDKPGSWGHLFIDNGNLLEMGLKGEVNLYNPDNNQWTSLPGTPNVNIFALMADEDALYVGGGNYLDQGDIYKKTATTTWQPIFGEGYRLQIAGLFAKKLGAYIGLTSACVVGYSQDQDKTFNYTKPVPGGDCGLEARLLSVGVSQNLTMASVALNSTNSVVYGSVDNEDWKYEANFKGDPPISFVQVGNDSMYSAAGNNQIVVSYDGGISWKDDSHGIPEGQSLRFATYDPQEQALYTSGGPKNPDPNGVYKRKLGSDTWENIGSDLPRQGRDVYGVAILDGYVYAVLNGEGAFRKPVNSSEKWVAISEGLPTTNLTGIVAFDNTLYVGTGDAGLFKYTPDSE